MKYTVFDFANHCYHLSLNISIRDVYPCKYAGIFFEGPWDRQYSPNPFPSRNLLLTIPVRPKPPREKEEAGDDFLVVDEQDGVLVIGIDFGTT
ncbi:uncharacterized protein PpBr36_11021 [Pyricularia pennisetigena]|uniref:uncharacterized protein n=1 Tax=Pyricularia pennisetigena TaxID=1578925 RepID=UPI00114D7C4B|nr:uncharacterized protein PpBr36_11021 [Pyricularia pennisetigena]TLS20762.1 hypothetical protein PpBr36_11021 [Pyricularia pennisetigena]